jgi:hypothetical protein
MPDLIALATTTFLVLHSAEAIARAIMQRDIYEFKDVPAGTDGSRSGRFREIK